MSTDNNIKARVLLAEDDLFIAKAYKDGLERAGFEVISASDGRQALELSRQESPDIILLDLIMPEMNGFEFLEVIRNDEKLKTIPVIILSNLGQDSDVSKGRDLGAVDYLIKSDYSMVEVVDKIRYYLKIDG